MLDAIAYISILEFYDWVQWGYQLAMNSIPAPWLLEGAGLANPTQLASLVEGQAG